ncbi:MAG: hypothetical protein PVF51_08750 [Nitrospirota bacterium]|jgi:hypothetical protein
MDRSKLFHVEMAAITILLLLSQIGCGGGGGGGGGGDGVKEGQFIDAPVEGLTFVSGDQSGVTDAQGRFRYKEGATVRFAIGDIVLGEVPAKPIITPVDLVTGANDESHPAVTNIARLLQTLDDDGDPGNGITIPEAVRSQAAGLSMRFGQAEAAFGDDGDVVAAVAALTALTRAGVRPLVSREQARSHLRETLVALTEPPPTSSGDGANGDILFHEGWERAGLGTYSPVGGDDVTVISGDEGSWLIGDTIAAVSDEPDNCGPSPHRAEILTVDGSRALRLTSADSGTGCGDNVWVDLEDQGPFNPGFSIPIAPSTEISFKELGELVNPGTGGNACLLPPCGDNISLVVAERRGTRVVYVLQRAPDAEPHEIGSIYREIFLDPQAGTYTRNLYDDFRAVPAFDPNGAEITIIAFQVDQHGSATLDDLVIREGTPSSETPESPQDPGATDELPPEDSDCDFFATAPGSTSWVAVDNRTSHAIEWRLEWNGNEIPLGVETDAGVCEGMGVPTGSYVAEIVSCASRDGDDCTGASREVRFSLADGETHTVPVTGSFF